jgi:hypothetical protein
MKKFTTPFPGLEFYFMSSKEFREILIRAHAQGFLDGLDAENYASEYSPGFDVAASKYAKEVMSETIDETMIGDSDNDEPNSYGNI